MWRDIAQVCKIFSRAKGEGNTTHECNVSPTDRELTQCEIYNTLHQPLHGVCDQTLQQYVFSKLSSSERPLPACTCTYIMSASQSHCYVRRLDYLCVVYAKHYSYGSEKRLGWRASGKQSGTTNTCQTFFHSLLSTLLTAKLAMVSSRVQRPYLSKTSCIHGGC